MSRRDNTRDNHPRRAVRPQDQDESDSESLPSYDNLDPRPPPYGNVNPRLASERPNGLDAWDYMEDGYSANFEHIPRPRSPERVLNHRLLEALYTVRSEEEHMRDPYPRVSANPLGHTPEVYMNLRNHRIAVEVRLGRFKELFCHQVFAAYWQCGKGCYGDRSYNRVNIFAALGEELPLSSSLSCSNCGEPGKDITVLANGQKQPIMLTSGEVLMSSRLNTERCMWCCHCRDLSVDGLSRNNNDCDHCRNPRGNRCPQCFWCNDYMEPTRFCNGDLVKYGILHVHESAVALRDGTPQPREARFSALLSELSALLRHLGPDARERISILWRLTMSAISFGILITTYRDEWYVPVRGRGGRRS